MKTRVILAIGLALCVAGVSCGTDTGTTSPKRIDGILLKAADLPSMRLEGEDPAGDAQTLAMILGGEEACLCASVFKSKPDVAAAKLKKLGYKRGYAEIWNGAGVQSGAFAAEFDTAAHATAALAYMKSELFKECPGNPYCSKRVEIKVPGIPDSVGQAFTPLRPKEEGREATLYKFLFQIGSSIFGVLDGATNSYDPGSVSQAQAVSLAKRYYDRVKTRGIDSIMRSTPSKPRGPGAEGPPPPPQA
jgi:hypothetical protein